VGEREREASTGQISAMFTPPVVRDPDILCLFLGVLGLLVLDFTYHRLCHEVM